MDVVRLVQLPLHIWQGHHDREVLPYIAVAKLERLANLVRCTELRSAYLASPDSQHSFAFEAVKVLSKSASVYSEIVTFDNE